jgi:hypothetical protein
MAQCHSDAVQGISCAVSVPLQTRAQKELLCMKHVSLMKIHCPITEVYGDVMMKHFTK